METKTDFFKIKEGEMANFWCPSKLQCQECASCSKNGAITTEYKEELFCPNTQEKLKYVGRPVINKIASSLSVGEIQSERKKRSKADFEKNILPSFAKTSDEAIHFQKKKMLKGE